MGADETGATGSNPLLGPDTITGRRSYHCFPNGLPRMKPAGHYAGTDCIALCSSDRRPDRIQGDVGALRSLLMLVSGGL